MFTLEEQTRNWERRHPQYARKAAPENAARYEAMRQMAEEVSALEEAAMVELEQLGCIEFEPQFNWHAKSTPEDRGWSRAVLDIIAEYGADVTESVFELF